MNQRNKIVEIAKSQIGGYPEINKFNRWYGAPGQAWCAMFVSWCAAQAGISTDIVPKLAYVPYEYEWFLKRNRWRSKSTYTPKAGDLIIFGTNSHIGIVEKVVGSTIFTIEGNTTPTGNTSSGDGVYRKQRGLYASWVKGYCVPGYIEEDDMSGEEIYNALQAYLAKQPLPDWAKAEMEEAKALGITDGKNPMQLIPRYQAAIMAKRALKNK